MIRGLRYSLLAGDLQFHFDFKYELYDLYSSLLAICYLGPTFFNCFLGVLFKNSFVLNVPVIIKRVCLNHKLLLQMTSSLTPFISPAMS